MESIERTLIQDLATARLLESDAGVIRMSHDWLQAYLTGNGVVTSHTQPLRQKWGMKAIIGLTGNIAVGKTTVLKELEALGAGVIDADRLVHDLRQPGMPGYKAVVALLGQGILLEDGRIDTGTLAARAFESPELLQELEAIFRPLVVDAVGQWAQRHDRQVLVVEAIKLLEGDLRQAVDEVWVVDAPREVQIQRLIDERGLTLQRAEQRINAQNPQSEKLSAADVVIRNGGSLLDTRWQVLDAWAVVLGRLAAAGWPIEGLVRRFLGCCLQAASSAFSVAEATHMLRQIAALMAREGEIALDDLAGRVSLSD